MRPVEFLFAIVDKFSPMSETDRSDLRLDANMDYVKIKNQIFETDGKTVKAEPKTLKQRFVYWSEKWEIRLVLALAFIGIVPKIQRYLHPDDDDLDYDDYDDEDDEFDDDDD